MDQQGSIRVLMLQICQFFELSLGLEVSNGGRKDPAGPWLYSIHWMTKTGPQVYVPGGGVDTRVRGI